MLFRNMVALEQCHYPEESYITDYVTFLGQLINTNKDADVLIIEGIINCIGGNNSTVAKLFNDVRENTTEANFNADYPQICSELNVTRCNSNAPKPLSQTLMKMTAPR